MSRCLILIGLLVALLGCDSSSSTRTTSTATPAATVTSLRAPGAGKALAVVRAPRGAVAFLVREDPTARDLYSRMSTIVTSTEVEADGRITFPNPPETPTGWAVLISAPGKAIRRAPLSEANALTLEPEAVCACTVRGATGEPEEDALALVLDAGGAVLPLPPAELVSRRNGTLRATRLPAGSYVLLISSGDRTRFARRAFRVGSGERIELSLRLAPDPDLELAFLRAVGGPGLSPLMSEVGR